MIRNVIIHMSGEQPLMADLRSLPTAQDVCLVCTNLRTVAGAKPIFIDHTDSWFLFPLLHVRFIEITAKSLAAGGAGGEEDGMLPVEVAEQDDELELDEDFLRRIREA